MEKKHATKKSLTQLGSLIRAHLWAQVLAGLFLGIGVGLFLSHTSVLSESATHTLISWLAMPGHLFLRVIQMIVIPLVIASVIRGIADTGDAETVKKLGFRIVLYFLFTTTIATAIGASLSTVLAPGDYMDSTLVQQTLADAGPTVEVPVPSEEAKNMSIPLQLVSLLPSNPFFSVANGDMLAIVIFAAIFGTALIGLPKQQARPLLDLAASAQEACMVIVSWVLRIAPLAVFGLMAEVSQKVGLDALSGMAVYVGAVILGLLCLLAFYATILMVAGGPNILSFLSKIKDVQLLAFSTSSSAAVMPVTLKVAEENLGLDKSVSRFVVPLGATINMDGTALYQTIATLFLAQVFGIDIGLSGLLLVLATSIGASIGTPGTPGVGIVVLASILISVGVPPAGIALIIGVDRILDMCRTTLNVTGDLVACVVMNRLQKR